MLWLCLIHQNCFIFSSKIISKNTELFVLFIKLKVYVTDRIKIMGVTKTHVRWQKSEQLWNTNCDKESKEIQINSWILEYISRYFWDANIEICYVKVYLIGMKIFLWIKFTFYQIYNWWFFNNSAIITMICKVKKI